MTLHDRTAIVTGAASGIGRAIAVEFARLGARVVVADIRQTPREGGPATCAVIAAAGGTARFVGCDLTRADDLEHLVAQAAAWSGRIDVLVNNAAVAPGAALLDTSDATWEQTLAVNVTAPFRLCRTVVRHMIAQEPRNEVRGRIVNIGSQHGMIAAPEDFAYGVSKAALIHMTRQIALDHAADGIVCNTVSPGKIDTGKGGPAMAPRWIEYSRRRTPLPRLGTPDDVARAVAFLASDQSTFTTGANLLVDGGWMAS